MACSLVALTHLIYDAEMTVFIESWGAGVLQKKRTAKLIFAFFIAVSALIVPGAGPAAMDNLGERPSEAPAIRVTMLGTGTPVPSPTQYGASILIEAGGQALLFDCGRGCGIRLAQARREIFNKLDGVFLTHLHSDHVVGLPDLWLNGWTLGRAIPLSIWGPVGTEDMMGGLRQAFAFDAHMRGEVERVPASMTGLQVKVVEFLEDGVIFRQGGVSVTAFLVDHAAIKPAFGFRIDYAGRSVLLSGDTRPTPNLVKYGSGVDLFILDVMSPMMIRNVRAQRASREAEIIIGHHTTASQAAEIFARTGPRLAVYTHTINKPAVAANLIATTREGYAGQLLVGEDLMEISIGAKIRVQRPPGSALPALD